MKRITIAVEGITVAIKARRTLRLEGISAHIVKYTAPDGHSGCTHALEVGEEDFFAAVSALRRASISYRTSGL